VSVSRRASTLLLLLCFTSTARAASPAPVASFAELPTGNGFGFAVFDARAKKVTQFLERPYRYLTAGPDPHGAGIYRRDLAAGVAFGVRGGGVGGWMPDQAQSEVGYVEQSNVIRSVGSIGPFKVESFYLSPYALGHNALVMIAKVTNRSAAMASATVFAAPDFRLGAGGDDPSGRDETITTHGAHTIETGALGEVGGAMVYVPILDQVAKADCSGTGAYTAVQRGDELRSDQRTCSGDDRTIIFQSTPLALAPGDATTFGLVIAFSPRASGAGALGDAIDTYLSGRLPEQLLSDELIAQEAWRTPPPGGLSDDERRVYRQAESTLRMAQVREPWQAQPRQKAHGMILASLPPGVWHIGWVRDAAYAIVALSRAGHLSEARDALRFFLSAEAGAYASYAGGPYRISVVRYFGDGQEESDWDDKGPNVEFDGWGLYLWALRQYLDAAGDGALLDEILDTGERTFDVVHGGVVEPLIRNLEPGGLVRPDNSIWESHWERRKHYAYTALAAARGLCDLGAIEQRYGEPARASAARDHATRVRTAIHQGLLDPTSATTTTPQSTTPTSGSSSICAQRTPTVDTDSPRAPTNSPPG
jgi:hypothetical protein